VCFTADFSEFLKVIIAQKAKQAGQDDESDTGATADQRLSHSLSLPRARAALDAFIALGGNADKTGEISTDKLRSIVKDFGLTIDKEVPYILFPPSNDM